MEGRNLLCERGRSEFGEIEKTVGTMLRYTRPIWNFENVVIMGSCFCVTKGLVEIYNKRVLGAALIKKIIYWPANIKGDSIDAHFDSKEVGNSDAVKQVEDEVAYHVFAQKSQIA